MNGLGEDLDMLLESLDDSEFEERARRPRPRPVPTPSRRSSFTPRPTPAVASQGQVQAAARNLDSKIETLTNAVKSLESRTSSLGTEQSRLASALKKENEERKKMGEGTRADLQQTKTMSVLLPLLTQKPVASVNTTTGEPVNVLTQPSGGLSSMLPFLLLLSPSSSGDGAKGPFGDSMMTVLMVALLADRK